MSQSQRAAGTRRLGLWLKLLGSAVVLTLLFWLLPWAEMRDSFSKLPGRVWVGVLAGFLAGHLVGASKWRLLVKTLGSRLPWSEGVRCYAAGIFSNLYLPGLVGGDVVRAAVAARSGGRTEAVILGGVADRAIDTVTLAALMSLGSFAAGAALPAGRLRVILWVIASALVIGSAVLIASSRRPMTAWPVRLRRPVGRALVAMRRLRRRPQAAAVSVVLAFGAQSLFILLNAWIGRSLEVEVPLPVWFVVWPMAKLAGLLPVSFGGLGVRDAALGALLGGFGVPVARGVVVSLIWQSVLITGGLIAGLLWWLLSARRGEQRGAGPRVGAV